MSASDVVKQPSVVQQILHFAKCGGTREAISEIGGRTVSWQAFGAALENCSGHINLALTGRAARTIAIVGDLSLDSVIAYFAVICSGHVAVPLSPKTNPQILRRLLENCQCDLVVGDDSVASCLPGEMQFRFISLQAFARRPSSGFEAWPSISPDALFDIVYSSGTTGHPKGIGHSHGSRDASLMAGKGGGFDDSCRILLATGFASNTTLASLIFGLAFGGYLILLRKFTEEDFFSASARYGVTHTTLVPVQYARIMRYEKFDRTKLSTYQMKYSTSAAMSPALKRDIVERWPGGFLEVYGMTEGGPTCLLRADSYPLKLHTVGQPAANCDIRIVADDGREQEVGEIGEIVGRSGLDTSGYLNRDSDSAALFWVSPAGQKFVRSGDLGRIDEDGFVEIVGRKKDVINSGGYNVYPKDLEEALEQHAAVEEVAVVGIPSPQWGETPVAFVVARDAGGATQEQLREWLAERVNRYQLPSQIHVVENLPRSEIGKVLKKQLREDLLAGQSLYSRQGDKT